MSIKMDPHVHAHTKELREAVKRLRDGGLLVYPTETAYALGADATNERAVARIFEIKERDPEKALPLILGSLSDAKKIAQFSVRALGLAERYWPGPLTLILPVRPRARLAEGVVKDGTVALRVSSHSVARALARHLGRPIVSTSANLAGKGTCYSVHAIHKQFRTFPSDLSIVDAGPLARRKVSTIVRVRDGAMEIIRKGSIRV